MNPQPGLGFSSLHDDIVMYIFAFNTDMSQPPEPVRKGFVNQDDILLTEDTKSEMPSFFMSFGQKTRFYALTITLRTSQVCRHWRKLLLASTATWGRLIDLDILSRTNPELRMEIFRRAGSGSSLSVKGFRLAYGTPTCDFAFDLIRDYWARLEWVNLYIKTDARLSREQTPFWSTITAPAPNLRHFTFVFSIPITTNPQVLTTNAPALRELCTSPSSPLQLNASWIHQLTFLSIDGVGKPEIPFTLPQFLDMLPHAPRIETLRLVYSRIAEGDYNEYRHIQLPSLRKLDLEDDFNTCFSVLRHLSPSSQCTLNIHAGQPHDISNEEYWTLSSTLERYLKERSYNDRILIDLQPKHAEFVDGYPDCYPEPTVSIHIDYDPGREHDRQHAQSFFDILPMGKFKHVEDIWFRVNLPTLVLHLGDTFGTYTDFHYCLDSVQVLKTTTQGLMLLYMCSSSIDESDEISVPLPRLDRVRMISDSDSNDYFDSVLELGPHFVMEFVDLFRKRDYRHRSIKHLDVRGWVGDFSGLDGCTGLKVTLYDARYRREGQPGEYICGSGNSEILNVED